MENSVECRICKESVLLTNATEMTPRQLAGIKVDKSNIEVSALVMIAQSYATSVYNLWLVIPRLRLIIPAKNGGNFGNENA